MQSVNIYSSKQGEKTYKSQTEANVVGRSGSLLVQSTGRELLSVKSNTKATFYTRAEKLSIAEEQDTSVVNLGLCRKRISGKYLRLVNSVDLLTKAA